jgi:hypothetical protein
METNNANMDTNYTPNFPYRLAHEINEHVTREVSQNDYFVGRAERDDIALDYVHHLIDQNAVEPSYIAFEGLFIWRRIFSRGLDGNGC